MATKPTKDLVADIGDRVLNFDDGPFRELYILAKCRGDNDLAQRVRNYVAGFKGIRATRRGAHPEEIRTRTIGTPRPGTRAMQILIGGRYQLIRPVGFGGMGSVFAAVDTHTNQLVAIKFIRNDLAANENARMRFVREARAAGKLQHPGIAVIKDIGQARGALFVVMEYVQGLPLTRVIASRQTYPFESKLHVITQVSAALDYAHSHGIVHRDIKPANIIVTPNRSIKIVDFGIACHSDLPNTIVEGSGTPRICPRNRYEAALEIPARTSGPSA